MNFPIYLISMEKDAERREKLKASFPESYEKFILVDAVNGGELSAKEYFDLAVGVKVLTPGQVGCSLSHVAALEDFLATDEPCALIVEDDIIGNEKSIETLSKILDKMFAHVSEFFLHCGGFCPKCKLFVLKRQNIGKEVFEIPPDSYGYLYMTSSYVVTRAVALEIVKRQRERLHEADDWLYLLGGICCGAYYSHIFSHPHDTGYASHIEHDKEILKKRRTAVLRQKIARETARILRQAWRTIRVLTGGYKTIKTE